MDNVKVPKEWPRKTKIKNISILLFTTLVVLSILISVN